MENLRKLRKERGLTLLQLANELHVAEGTISSYETGRRQPDNEMLKKIADYFNVSIDYLLGRDNRTPTFISQNTISIIGRGGGKKDIVLDDEQFQAVKTILENIAKQNEENN